MKRDPCPPGVSCPHCGQSLDFIIAVYDGGGLGVDIPWVVCHGCARFAVADGNALRIATAAEVTRAESGPVGPQLRRWRDRFLWERIASPTVLLTDPLSPKGVSP